MRTPTLRALRLRVTRAQPQAGREHPLRRQAALPQACQTRAPGHREALRQPPAMAPALRQGLWPHVRSPKAKLARHLTAAPAMRWA